MDTLEPQQLVKEAQAEYQNRNFQAAAKLYQAAAESYCAKGDDISRAEMANNCSVAYLNGGEAGLALQATQGSEQVFEKIGDLKQQGMAIGNQAAALEKLKRQDEAVQAYQRSAELLEAAGEYELRAYVMKAMSMLQLRQRRYLEAYATLRAGIMGVKHPNVKQRLLRSLIQIPYRLIR
jgi:tetratricopeptide (TPR) repeat protein